jgi:RNA polymerase sigma-70 factor (ECF subfamily)
VAPPAQALEPLIARSALGDRAAFHELYQASAPKLFAVALRILRREDWAEEVLQECYVSVWRHAGEYNAARAAPMTWMTSIVRNRCLDWLRRPNREVTLARPDDDADDPLENVPSDDPGPLDELARSADAKALGDCLRRLDPKQRQAIMLAFYEGLSHSELASHMREPLGTVKTWVRRGLERLKSCLGTM